MVNLKSWLKWLWGSVALQVPPYDVIGLFNFQKWLALGRMPCGTDVNQAVRSHSCACGLFLKVECGSMSEP